MLESSTLEVSCTKAAERSSSTGPKERRNWSEVAETGRASATIISLEAQMSNNLGNLTANGDSPNQQSVQKNVFLPFPTTNLEPSLKKCLILLRLRQN
jgi:hypothetical protein